MQVFFKVVGEILLALGSIFAGTMIWGVMQKNRFMRAKINDQEFLCEWLREVDNAQPLSARSAGLSPMPLGYSLNLEVNTRATIRADRTLQLIGILLIIGVFVLSYFVGMWGLVINIAIFLITSVIPISGSQARNALGTILETALIIYRWNKDAPEECREFLKDTATLKKVYLAVSKLDD